MISIDIAEEVETISELPYILRHIADLIESGGYRGGVDPTWSIEGEEEEEE